MNCFVLSSLSVLFFLDHSISRRMV